MGRDKALLAFAGRPLIALAVEKLRSLGMEPRIAGARADLAQFAEVVPDNFADAGPLGGLEAALAVSDAELNLFLPVDLPLLPVEFLRWMVERVSLSSAAATIPFALGRPQPLCAVYSRALLPGLRAALAAGDFKVMRAIEGSGFVVDGFNVEPVAAALGWEDSISRWFANANTPEEFAVVESWAGGSFRFGCLT